MRSLFYGDNLDIMRKYIPTASVDLIYIDPPFNSKRNYNQIYNNLGKEDAAQAEAFVDTWVWDIRAQEGYDEIAANADGRFAVRTVELIKGFRIILGTGSLLAYLVSMALRITEMHRVLKPTGTFYLHCDPTAGHYLKILLDAIFDGNFRNEIIWCYAGGGIPKKDLPRKHDTIFRYTKSDNYTYNPVYRPYSEGTQKRGRTAVKGKYFEQGLREAGTPVNDWWTDVPKITSPTDPEKLGYPTQKPEALLDRIISMSSKPGDVVLDAYCGCGTTVAVAERTGRKWIGIDITYQSISLILSRLEHQYGAAVLETVELNGIPRDMASVKQLAEKKDDRVRKEFEKWAVLTYTRNRAVINEKKGADRGIDGIAYFLTGPGKNGKIVFQVKSGAVGRADIAAFNSDRIREGADMGVFLTLRAPTRAMLEDASAHGIYHHAAMNRSYPRIAIVSIAELILKNGARLEIPLGIEVLRKAAAAPTEVQDTPLFTTDDPCP